jgi:radical SAM protein with 4Fe4S-binding SPASM domain
MKIETENHKLIYHPERVSEWLRRGDCYPVYIEIGPTNRCNHHCIFCALDWINKKYQDINPEVLNRTFKEMDACGVKSVMFAGEGEPFLHPDICEFVINAKSAGLDVAMATNGVLFTEEKIRRCLPHLSWVRYSLDAGTADTHSKIHKCGKKDFEKTLDNIRKAVAFKKQNNYPVIIGVQFLIIPENLNEIGPFIEIMKDIGVDNVQLKPYSQHPLSKNRFSLDVTMIDKISKNSSEYGDDSFQVIFRQKSAHRVVEEKPYNECYGLPFYALIEADGSIIPCNLFHTRSEFSYGNLYHETFSEIWRSEKRHDVIAKIKEMGIETCRKGCRLDPANRYLDELKHPHPHANFI